MLSLSDVIIPIRVNSLLCDREHWTKESANKVENRRRRFDEIEDGKYK